MESGVNVHLLSAFKLQLLPMFLDTAHNDVVTVLSNLAHSFSTCAVRCAGYLKEVLSAFKNQKGSAARILIRKSRLLIRTA